MPIRSQFATDEEWRRHLRTWLMGQALTGLLAYAGGPEEGAPEPKLPGVVADLCGQYADQVMGRI